MKYNNIIILATEQYHKNYESYDKLSHIADF